VNESRIYEDFYTPFFPFFSLPFSSYATKEFNDIARDEAYNMRSDELFKKYENVVASIHVNLNDRSKIIKHSYTSNADLVKISNHF
jgi:hypothetical protein